MAAISFIAIHSTVADEMRTWTDSTGKFRRDAEFVERTGDVVTLRLKSGTTTDIPFERLSDADKTYVEQRSSPRPTFMHMISDSRVTKPDSGLEPSLEMACDRLGNEIEAALRRGDDVLARWVDTRGIAERCIQGLGVPATAVEAVIANTVTDLSALRSDNRCLSPKGQHKFLWARSRDGHTQLEFRSLDAGGRPGYFAFMLESDANDTLPIKDIYLYAAGESITSTLRRGWVIKAAEINPDVIPQLNLDDSDTALIKHKKAFDEICNLALQNKTSEALAATRALPEDLRRNRVVLQMLCAIAGDQGQENFIKAVDLYAAAFPDDGFIRLNQSLVQKQNDKSLSAMEAIRKTVGPDPYLDYIAGDILANEGDTKGAIEHLIRAVAAEPGLTQAYDRLLYLYLDQKDFEIVAQILDYVEHKFNAKLLKTVSSDPAYKEFLSSKAGRFWQSAR